jgi:hypothetical protein
VIHISRLRLHILHDSSIVLLQQLTLSSQVLLHQVDLLKIEKSQASLHQDLRLLLLPKLI